MGEERPHPTPRHASCSGSVSHSAVSGSFQPPGLSPTSPWNSPGRNTGVGCDSLLQGIFQTQGLNWGLQHCRQILCHLSRQGRCVSRSGGPRKIPYSPGPQPPEAQKPTINLCSLHDSCGLPLPGCSLEVGVCYAGVRGHLFSLWSPSPKSRVCRN